jgi:DNA-binding transcriptional ArsR family regulator
VDRNSGEHLAATARKKQSGASSHAGEDTSIAAGGQLPVEVIEDAAVAAVALDPARLEILEALREPDSAASIARRLGQPRQRVGYHLKELEKRGLVRHVEDRRRGNCVERIVQATARHYLVSPAALGPVGADPAAIRDRFSSAYLVAVTARTLRDVATLQEKARAAGRKLPTMTLQVDVRFADPVAQNGFAEDLANAVASLAARYHDAEAPGGRTFRFAIGGYPAPPEATPSPSPQNTEDA